MKSSMLVRSIAGVAMLAGGSLLWAIPGATLSDADLLTMLDTIDRSEIGAAKLAQQKASSEEVKAFASQMLKEHTMTSQDTRQLAQRMNVRPEPPAIASTTEQANQKMMEELSNKSGQDFDQSYMKYQIRMHEQAIGLVQNTAGTVGNPQLREHLRLAGTDLEGHLAAARSIEHRLVAQR